MLLSIVGIAACLAGLSLSLVYAVSDIRKRAGARDEEHSESSGVAHDNAEDRRLAALDETQRWKPHKQSAGAQTATIAAAVVISALLATCLVALRREPSLPYIPSMLESLGLSDHDAPKMKCIPPGADERLAMFGNLHGYSHAISTSSSRAQQLFDQGLLLGWSFNQPEAFQAFTLAAEEDPASAMAEWGRAYALGPGANREVVASPKLYPSFYPPEHFPPCHEHSQRALRLARQALRGAAAAGPEAHALLQRELAYAEAQAARFANGTATQPERDAAQQRYSELMEGIGERYQDAHAKALAAEGYMTIRQWDYYEEDGQLRPEAERAERLIKEAIQQDPKNPLAHHLHIHVSETARQTLSANALRPGRAEASGVMMTFNKGPWQDHLGHLLHMPGHIHIRTGRWKDAVTANVLAYKADMELTKHCMIAYGPEHNTDMLIYAANMAGMSAVAEEFGEKLRGYQEVMFPAAYGDGTREWTHLVLTKVMFAKWDDILAIREVPETARGQCPHGGLPYATTIYHYARTLALAAKTEGALQRGLKGERQKLQSLAETSMALLLAWLRAQEAAVKIPQEEATVPGESPGIYGCDYQTLARISVLHAEARMALLHREPQVAVAKLEAAKEVEDGMSYMEPPRLYQPIRHCLGYVLSNVTGDHAGAEQAYREDLLELPHNGWSLLGLGLSLKAQGKPEADAFLSTQYPAVWKNADVLIETSCPVFSQL